jgi:hypothetical protein
MRTGFCSECQSVVRLDGDGNCVNGHPATVVSGVSEVADTSEAGAPTAPEAPSLVPARDNTPINKRRWLLPAILFMSGLIVGAAIALAAVVPNTDRVNTKLVMLQSENVTLKAQVKSLTNERNSLQGELAPIKAAIDAANTAADKVAASTPPDKTAPSGKAGASPNAGAKRTDLPANSFPPGVYLVGTDIPAGRYVGTPVAGGYAVPYWKISSLANGGDIVESDRPTGQFYVQVKKGQYLTLDSVVIALIK